MSREYYKRKVTEFEFLPMSKAQELGYISYSTTYRPVTEQWMIENAVADILQNGRDRYCLVKIGSFVEIWIIPSYYRKGYVFNHHGDDDTPEADAPETQETAEEEIILPEESFAPPVLTTESIRTAEDMVETPASEMWS